MEAQLTLVQLEATPASQLPAAETKPPKKLVFGRPAPKADTSESNTPVSNPKLKPINRSQLKMKTVDFENLLGPFHPARGIWKLMDGIDFSAYNDNISSQVGEKGRPSTSPKMLASVFVYAYSLSISSAREIERQMEHEPGLVWLCGDIPINHHTLSDFRVAHKEALDDLFKNVLAALDGQGLIDLSQVMHDGTKIQAHAGAGTFRRKQTIEQRLEKAKQLIKEMGDPREDNPTVRTRKQAAETRAAREQVEKLEAAMIEIEQLSKAAKTKKADKVRVSVEEPQARRMKHGNHGGIMPSYNAQISTESSNKIIVGVHLSQSSSDVQSLARSVDEVEQSCGVSPDQVVVDGGYISQSNVIEMEKRTVELIGPQQNVNARRSASAISAGIDPAFSVQFFIIGQDGKTIECPAGKKLTAKTKSKKRGNEYQVYWAEGSDCGNCEFQKKCCPRTPDRGRRVSILVKGNKQVKSFREKMESDRSKEIYKKRGPVAEFPNAWIKDKLGVRKFRLKGLAKAGMETMWACLTYNIQQWMRLCWRKQAVVECAA